MPTNEHFVEIERRLNALVRVLDAHLSADERHVIVEFIDVGEYGLALETIVDSLVQTEKTLPHVAFAEITTLAGRMSMESVLTEELQRRVK
jgi:hypothetical protein